MATDSHDIILDHLRAIRGGQAEMKGDLAELKASITSLRGDVHAVRGDMLRQERALAAVEVDVDRIKARLDIADDPGQ